jgi:hypothetical protein
MTSDATSAVCSRVARVIEFHIEAAQSGKRFQRSGLRVAVTNAADRIR